MTNTTVTLTPQESLDLHLSLDTATWICDAMPRVRNWRDLASAVSAARAQLARAHALLDAGKRALAALNAVEV